MLLVNIYVFYHSLFLFVVVDCLFPESLCFLILFLDTIVRFPSCLANGSSTMAFLLLLKFTFVYSVLSGSLFTLLLIEGVSFWTRKKENIVLISDACFKSYCQNCMMCESFHASQLECLDEYYLFLSFQPVCKMISIPTTLLNIKILKFLGIYTRMLLQ